MIKQLVLLESLFVSVQSALNSHVNPWGWLHFTKEEIEAQRGSVTCPSRVSRMAVRHIAGRAKLGFWPRNLAPVLTLLTVFYSLLFLFSKVAGQSSLIPGRHISSPYQIRRPFLRRSRRGYLTARSCCGESALGATFLSHCFWRQVESGLWDCSCFIALGCRLPSFYPAGQDLLWLARAFWLNQKDKVWATNTGKHYNMHLLKGSWSSQLSLEDAHWMKESSEERKEGIYRYFC